ncbi:hypothetical protein PTSG_12231 [Salpingoeca rosetta]|uniref:Transmembrane protein 267 n=1 Tax=Salpingoeca rosetta (strain ATCC 50818 / BSB-021) TaxID=946362 RepID=F2U948_SALR5|nr:uncharacterized protein PTSG_12231 [Salpingoeca rosetta]EGD73251.1 hypothetical protein PTSG_12231 [Salpingoeca rosetta]|eukprot:XP_004994282.1 hypothetical protein PTSG_12231 [Salpingoeca rosetta]
MVLLLTRQQTNALVVVCGVGLLVLPPIDHVIETRPFASAPRWLYALLDNVTHASVAFCLWQLTLPDRGRLRYHLEAVGSAAIASLLDLDHFVQASSVHLKDAVSLSRRPPLHSTTFSLCIIAGVYVLASAWRWWWHRMRVHGTPRAWQPSPILFLWLPFSAVFSHHIRDAYRRGLWLGSPGSATSLSSSSSSSSTSTSSLSSSGSWTLNVSYSMYLFILVLQAALLSWLGASRAHSPSLRVRTTTTATTATTAAPAAPAASLPLMSHHLV